MKTEKRDRRVKYTKLVLKESLVKLLQKMALDKVTVKELCETADINRTTFYSHYADQYDLFRQIQQEVLEDLSNYMANYSYQEGEAELRIILERIFDYIVENADLCKVLLFSENSAQALQQAMLKIVEIHTPNAWKGINAGDKELIEYLQLFGISGSIGIVKRWLETGMTKSAREMADVVVKLTYRGLSAYV